ncbi:UTRA domain-containing protein [Sporolactobacillus sp. KGMB 08714]|uniref:UTRA domain-containing protein n=1 Tax=Sporolactobacillus sp. KGMB 08714 TaxID=3064704 RepID=UPI002FBF187D
MILDEDFLLMDVVPKLTADICEYSLSDYIENELNLKIGFQQTEETRQYLTLSTVSSAVVVRSLVYLDNARLFQFTELSG